MMTLRPILLVLLSLSPIFAQEEPGTGPVDRTGANPSTPVRRPGTRDRAEGDRRGGFSDPRRWLFLAVVGFLVVGGGRKWLTSRRGRALADRIAEMTASPEEIRGSSRYGRDVVHDLFRMMSEGPTPEHRAAAVEALVKLWRADELIPEEEKAIVTRSLNVDWRIRRKYPHGLQGPIAVRAHFGIPTLPDGDLNTWLNRHLRWSYRVTGTRRASDDAWHQVTDATPRACFAFMAEDFPDDGPHRLILHLKVSTFELTDSWALELPAQSTTFELDPHLQAGALAGMPDSVRADAMRRAVEPASAAGDDDEPVYVALGDRFALRNPPLLTLALTMPADLSHAALLELEGMPNRWTIGEWIEPGDRSSVTQTSSTTEPGRSQRWPEVLGGSGAETPIERGGRFRGRIVLEPRPERGWSDPEIRSVWPEPIASDWFEVEIVRR